MRQLSTVCATSLGDNKEYLHEFLLSVAVEYPKNSVLPSNGFLSSYHPNLMQFLAKFFLDVDVKNYKKQNREHVYKYFLKGNRELSPQARYELAGTLNFDSDQELLGIGPWTEDRLKVELKNFIDEFGVKDNMPKQKELSLQNRSDLVGAIQKFGGQAAVANQLGLKPNKPGLSSN